MELPWFVDGEEVSWEWPDWEEPLIDPLWTFFETVVLVEDGMLSISLKLTGIFLNGNLKT
jgi:hypothetical protein